MPCANGASSRRRAATRRWSTWPSTSIPEARAPRAESGPRAAFFMRDGRDSVRLGSKLRVYDTRDWHLIRTLDIGIGWGRGYMLTTLTAVDDGAIAIMLT